MAYEKQNWDCGDTITAEKLNHMEDGIAEASQGGGSDVKHQIVTGTFDSEAKTLTLNNTWKEIYDMLANNIIPIISADMSYYADDYDHNEKVLIPITRCDKKHYSEAVEGSYEYWIYADFDGANNKWSLVESENDYPVMGIV